jgi:WD40 repeat protein
MLSVRLIRLWLLSVAGVALCVAGCGKASTGPTQPNAIKLQPNWMGHIGPVYAVQFDPAGTLLATGGDDGMVKFWDLSTGEPRPYLNASGCAWHSLRFTQNGRMLLAGGGESNVCIADLAARNEMCIVHDSRGKITLLAYFDDGKTLVTGDAEGIVSFWHGTTSQAENRTTWREDKKRRRHPGRNLCLAITPDGKILASAGAADDAGVLRVWDVATDKRLMEWRGHEQGVPTIALSPDGRTLVSGSIDKTVKVWDVANGKERFTLAGHTKEVLAIAMSPDGKTLISGSVDGTVVVWDLVGGRQLATLEGDTASAIYSVAASADGRFVSAGRVDGTVSFWQLQK